VPQALAKLHLHLVFSTKHREAWLHDAVRDPLHAYMTGVFAKIGCPLVAVGSIEDHVHVLFELSRTMPVCDAVEAVKSASSRWLKTQGDEFGSFAWQAGYGVFAVSSSNIRRVCAYIASQREHHRRADFRAEYRGLLERHQVAFDARHVWD
jgi:putative transposase